jgi:hypothetical protein
MKILANTITMVVGRDTTYPWQDEEAVTVTHVINDGEPCVAVTDTKEKTIIIPDTLLKAVMEGGTYSL